MEDKQVEIKKLWQAFVLRGENVSLKYLREDVAASWRYSRDCRVPPDKPLLIKMEPHLYEQHKEANKQFVTSILPHLHKLFLIINDQSAFITFADKDGVLLEVLANSDFSSSVPVYIMEGCMNQEKAIGTNSIGLCLRLDKPMEILGAEHYKSAFHDLTCCSVPLHYRNSLIGCVSVTKKTGDTFSYDPRLLSMTITTVYAIERELVMRISLDRANLIIAQQQSLLNFIDTGLIAIDEKGIIKLINNQIYKIFGLNGSFENKGLDSLFTSSIDFLSLAREGKTLESQDIQVKANGKYLHLICSTSTIQKNPRSQIYILISLRAVDVVRKLVNSASGALSHYTFKDIITQSEEMSQPLKIAQLASTNTANVLVMGETGTGKELIVQAIHSASEREDKPFVAINCGAISRELIQSELFGYEGGSFTGAKIGGNMGKFELADGGTLFLDEIGEMPLDTQVVLLRVLQNHAILRIGGQHQIPVDVRVIAATHQNLEEAVQQGTFRADLFYRLNVLSIYLPPLRERRGDVRLLAHWFLEKFDKKFGKQNSTISEEAYQLMEAYDWPGNIRELENLMQRAVVLCEGKEILARDLLFKKQEKGSASLNQRPSVVPFQSLQNQRKEQLLHCLILTKGNLKRTAELMHVSRGTIYNMMNEYQLDATSYRK